MNALLEQVGLRFGPGRKAAPVEVHFDRELTVDDLLAAETSTLVQKLPPLQRLRQSHHQVARLLAQGLSNIEVSEITGKDPLYIGNLKTDPSFKELYAYYESMERDNYETSRADMHKRLAALGFDSIEILHERLEEKPESFSNKEILAVVEAMTDRTGFGKTSKVEHEHSHSLSAETIERVKRAAHVPSAVAEADRQSLLRIASLRTAEKLPEAQEAEWVEGTGSGVREEGGEGTVLALLDGEGGISQVD